MFESCIPLPFKEEIVILQASVEINRDNKFGIVKPGYIEMRGLLLPASLGSNPVPDRFGYILHDSSNRHNELGRIVFDDCSFPTTYSNSIVECLWLDPGIVESADLEEEPERCTGGFGIALSPQSMTKEGVVYIRELDSYNSVLGSRNRLAMRGRPNSFLFMLMQDLILFVNV
jgi:hypothetical protein